MASARVGIAGSAKVEGATRTHGVPGTAGIMRNSPISRPVLIWGIALGVLFFFHVGGAKLG